MVDWWSLWLDDGNMVNSLDRWLLYCLRALDWIRTVVWRLYLDNGCHDIRWGWIMAAMWSLGLDNGYLVSYGIDKGCLVKPSQCDGCPRIMSPSWSIGIDNGFHVKLFNGHFQLNKALDWKMVALWRLCMINFSLVNNWTWQWLTFEPLDWTVAAFWSHELGYSCFGKALTRQCLPREVLDGWRLPCQANTWKMDDLRSLWLDDVCIQKPWH